MVRSHTAYKKRQSQRVKEKNKHPNEEKHVMQLMSTINKFQPKKVIIYKFITKKLLLYLSKMHLLR